MRDLIGEAFGRLTVVEYAGKEENSGHNLWLCVCECEEETTIAQGNLLSGTTQSCGCLHRERVTTHGHAGRGAQTPTYKSWLNMLSRCEDPNDVAYVNYGARGISVCDEWHEFGGFLASMRERPPGTSLDRIDNNGDYGPDNCRWATPSEQRRNTRANRLIEYDGREQCLTTWAEEFGMNPQTLRTRLNRDWTVGEALTTPVGGRD